MAVRFLRDYTVQDRERTTYAKDEVRDDPPPSPRVLRESKRGGIRGGGSTETGAGCHRREGRATGKACTSKAGQAHRVVIGAATINQR